MNKTIITIIIGAVAASGGYFLIKGAYQPTPPVSQALNQQTAPQPPTGQTPNAEYNVVIYTDAGYSPNTITIKAGKTVTWKNQSPKTMWTASGIHPIHSLYPTTGGCIGSTFDACQGIQPDQSWSFKFDIAGTWEYHNHLSPGDTGTIAVE